MEWMYIWKGVYSPPSGADLASLISSAHGHDNCDDVLFYLNGQQFRKSPPLLHIGRVSITHEQPCMNSHAGDYTVHGFPVRSHRAIFPRHNDDVIQIPFPDPLAMEDNGRLKSDCRLTFRE